MYQAEKYAEALEYMQRELKENDKNGYIKSDDVIGRLGKIEIDNGKQIIKITSGK